jgi:hypothetical protein
VTSTRTRRSTIALLLGSAVAVVALASCAGEAAPPTTTRVLSADEACAAVPAAAVAAGVGAAWPRAVDLSGGCRYQSPFAATSTITITGTPLGADAWRTQVTRTGGQVTDHGGVLVADYGGDGFGPLDELWWTDADGHALVMRVDYGVTLDQALAVIDNARRGTPGTTGVPGSTGTVPSAAPRPTQPA